MRMQFKAALLAFAALIGSASASETFPDGPVTLVVPYSPGGTTDIFARQLASELQEKWGQPVIVENRAGAGSMIGTAYVSQSRPDGHTLLFNSSAHVTAPAIHGDLPFDPRTDMTPVAMVSYSPFLLVAGRNVEATSLSDLLSGSADQPFFIATAGLGSSSHFAAELFSAQSGLDVEIVHYAGSGEAVTDLMGGHADLYVSSTAGLMAAVANGQVHSLGVLGAERYDALPGTQSSGEAGMDIPDIRIWQGVFGPGSMPEGLVAKIAADIADVVGGSSYRAVLERNYTLPANMSEAEFGEMVDDELTFWKALAEERGIGGP